VITAPCRKFCEDYELTGSYFVAEDRFCEIARPLQARFVCA
jgi:hypothetical protein